VRRTALAVLLLAAAMVVPASAADGPLQPLTGIAKHMDDGISGFLAGKALAEAFAPWSAVEEEAAATKAIRDAVAKAGGTTAKAMFLEFELYLMKGDGAVLYLRTQVSPDATKPAFYGVEARPAEGAPSMPSVPAAELKGPSQPFSDAATALWKALAGDGWKSFAWVEAALLEAILPEGPMRTGMQKEIDASKQAVGEVAKRVAASGADGVRVRVDDAGFVVRDAAGRTVGVLSGELRLPGQGAVDVSLKSFMSIESK
jgi:hypothetical protein